jgi:hypothetical protein
VPEQGRVATLEDRQYVTVVLRFVLERDGRIVHGEIVDAEGTVLSRFVDWPGLIRGLELWFERQS